MAKDKDKDKKALADPSPVGKIKWLSEVAGHDYEAVEAYLSIKLEAAAVAKAVGRLREAELTTRRRTTSSAPRVYRPRRWTTPAPSRT
jgi:hypothetical protein